MENECKYEPFHLDDLLTAEECAGWLRLRKREILEKSKGRNPAIPGFWINQRVVRFHPRTILAKMAHDAGVSPEVIAASLALTQRAMPNPYS